MSKVTMYDSEGWMGDLVELNVGRFDHGCGHYVDSNNYQVGHNDFIFFFIILSHYV